MFSTRISQFIFEKLYKLSQLCMNIGQGAEPSKSGEINVLKFLNKQFKNSQMTIFDVGANTGSYLCLLDKLFEGRGEIYSFEPSSPTFKELTKNAPRKKNIHIYNIGFSDYKGEASLFSDKANSGLASLYKRDLTHINMMMDKSEIIQVTTIDQFCLDQRINKINFLKLDIEGHELFALKGAQNMLDKQSIDYIQFEFGGTNIDSRTFFRDFFNLLDNQFQIFRILKNGLFPIKHYKEIYECFLCTNFLAQNRKIKL